MLINVWKSRSTRLISADFNKVIFVLTSNFHTDNFSKYKLFTIFGKSALWYIPGNGITKSCTSQTTTLVPAFKREAIRETREGCRYGISQGITKHHSWRAAQRPAWRPERGPFPGIMSGTYLLLPARLGRGCLVETKISPHHGVSTRWSRSTTGCPWMTISALSFPKRVELPPARIKPLNALERMLTYRGPLNRGSNTSRKASPNSIHPKTNVRMAREGYKYVYQNWNGFPIAPNSH